MASRTALPKLPKIDIQVDRSALDERVRRGLAARPTDRGALGRVLWQLITLPYWAFSDSPRPHLPARNEPLPHGGLAGSHVVASIDSIVRRVWIQRALNFVARGAWLGLFIGCLWLLVELAGGPRLDRDRLIVIAIVLFVPSLAIAILARPTRRQTAVMLDRSFGLQERMTTAIGNLGRQVPADGERAQVVYLQVADAANVAAALKRHSAFRVRPPIRELVLAIAFALVFASLYFLRGGGGDVPPVQANAVPPFIPAAERFINEPDVQEQNQPASTEIPSVAEVQDMAAESNEARQDLQALADALSDNALTHSVADSIQRGAYSEGAQGLRDLSMTADQLTQAERESLAEDLEFAESQMSSSDAPLAEASQRAAEGLREGGEAANTTLRELGDAVEETASSIASQADLDQQLQQAQAAEQAQGSSSDDTLNQQGSASQSSAMSGSSEPGQQSSSGEQGSSDQRESSSQQGSEPEPGAGTEAMAGGEQEGSEGNEPGAASQGGAGAGPPEEQGMGSAGQGSESPGESAESIAGLNDIGTGVEQGTGAGGGGTTEVESEEGSAPGASNTGEQPETNSDPSDANVTDAAPTVGEAQEPLSQAQQAISLARSPQGESVQIAGGSDGSRRGTGAGVTVSGGSSTQGVVGESGPDSNHVPAAYRPIVESYFSDPDGG